MQDSSRCSGIGVLEPSSMLNDFNKLTSAVLTCISPNRSPGKIFAKVYSIFIRKQLFK